MSHCALDIFAAGKHVNHRDEYILEIPYKFTIPTFS